MRTNAVFSRIALVPCFCAENQLSGKIPENIAKVLLSQKTQGARRRGAEGPGVGQTGPRRGPRPGRAWVASGRLQHLSASPFAYMTYVTRNPGWVRVFREISLLRHHHQKPYSGDQELRSGTL